MITITLPEWIATVLGILLSISLGATVLGIAIIVYKTYDQWRDERNWAKRRKT